MQCFSFSSAFHQIWRQCALSECSLFRDAFTEAWLRTALGPWNAGQIFDWRHLTVWWNSCFEFLLQSCRVTDDNSMTREPYDSSSCCRFIETSDFTPEQKLIYRLTVRSSSCHLEIGWKSCVVLWAWSIRRKYHLLLHLVSAHFVSNKSLSLNYDSHSNEMIFIPFEIPASDAKKLRDLRRWEHVLIHYHLWYLLSHLDSSW